MRYADEYLKANGYETDSIGLYKHDSGNLLSSDVILLPVPATKDGKTVYCPLTDQNISLDILKDIPDNKLILSGNLPLENKNSVCYAEYDDFAVKNAVLTAEGAIAYAIQNTDFALCDANVLITGFGRVSKTLLTRITPLCKNVTVSARKDADFAYISSLNVKHVNTYEIKNSTEKYDVIFNSIDAPILNGCEEMLKGTVIIDLSTKGCIEKTYAESIGAVYFKLPGIPGKTAPKTAGKIISDTVIRLITARR